MMTKKRSTICIICTRTVQSTVYTKYVQYLHTMFEQCTLDYDYANNFISFHFISFHFDNREATSNMVAAV